MTREIPALDQPASAEAIETATVLMTLVGAIRTAAQVFGCESQRFQLVQSAVERITTFVDLTIEAVNAGDADDEARALGLIETLARLLLLIDATDAAKTVRRRAAAAGTASQGSNQAATTTLSPRAA